MSNTSTTRRLPSEIRSLLRGLRWRIRAYVWLDGLLTAFLWLGVTFWVVLALDYFPVLLWASELNWEIRAVLLGLIALVLAAILYRRVISRTFVRLPDRSMAVLLERRYPRFGESLVTTVELSQRSGERAEYNPQLLDETERLALSRLTDVRLGPVFRRRPLILTVLGVSAIALSLIAFAALDRSSLELGFRRLYLLSEETWPRRAEIDVVGVDIERMSPRTGELSWTETLPFVDGRVKVARGTNAVLRVRANAGAIQVPDYCRIYYRLEAGTRGQVNMRRDGGVGEDNFQLYSFSGKPFQAILDDMQFDVVGYDHRLRNFHIEVVENPAVISTVLDCEFPSYLRNPDLGLWMPREMNYRSSGTELPQGTQLTIRMRSNKDLQRVEFVRPDTGEVQTLELQEGDPPREFEYPVASLDSSLSLEVSLYDTDNVLTESPHRIFITAVEDRPPQVEVYVRGIGSAVTPDVAIPARGEVSDDYGADSAWFEFQINDRPARKQPIALAADGSVNARLDMRELRTRSERSSSSSPSATDATHPESSSAVELEPGDRLSLQIRAQDRYDLGSGPNVGSTPRLDLEVVTPDELLIRLDRRELAERRRFEHILDEMIQMRDSLVRVEDALRTERLTEEDSEQPVGSESSDSESEVETSPRESPDGDLPEGEAAEGENAEGEVAEGIGPEEAGPEEVSLELAGVEEAGPDGDSVEQPSALRAAELAGIDLPGLQIQQAQRQSEKSADEVLGIAASFRSIREELVNNRVDSEDRQSRLENLVAAPLQRIGQTMFPELDTRLKELETARNDRVDQVAAAEAALGQTNDVIDELNQVLEAMLDIESYNELIEIVRSLIEDQQRLQDETRRIRRRAIRDLLD